ncbi:MAG: hypothetical protein LBG58_16030 [Planctomycetaceae bacterium]|nr:hypothetical protein [Planctomycetaceae bacterium]
MVKNKLQSPKNSTDILLFTMLFRWCCVIQIKTLIPYHYNAKPTARLETSRRDVKNCSEI